MSSSWVLWGEPHLNLKYTKDSGEDQKGLDLSGSLHRLPVIRTEDVGTDDLGVELGPPNMWFDPDVFSQGVVRTVGLPPVVTADHGADLGVASPMTDVMLNVLSEIH